MWTPARLWSPPRWVHVGAALHEHRAELWCERHQRGALARRHPLLPGRNPVDPGVTGPCDEYSPGAFRFALAIVSAVTQYPHQTLASLVLERSVTASPLKCPERRASRWSWVSWASHLVPRTVVAAYPSGASPGHLRGTPSPAKHRAKVHVGWPGTEFSAAITDTIRKRSTVKGRNSCWRGARAAESDSLLTSSKHSIPSYRIH